jgi:PAS domain S-box-containing protein
MVMHPMRPELDGKTVDGAEFRLLVNGREQNLFAALRDLAKADGQGFAEYAWPKPGPDGAPGPPAAKISFVRHYPPLDWIIGTGRHVDDIEVAIAELTAGAEAQVSRLVRSIVLASLAAVVLAVLGVSALTASLARPLGALVALSRDIAEDDKHLSRRIGLRSRDEIGQLATEFDHMAERVEASFRGVREQRELLQSVLGNVPHAIWWKDRRLVFLGCNERFAERFGLPATDAIVGKTDAELGWSEAQRARSAARDRGVLETGEPLLDERETLRDAAGNDLECLASRVPLRDQAGNLIGVLGVFVALPRAAVAAAAAS